MNDATFRIHLLKPLAFNEEILETLDLSPLKEMTGANLVAAERDYYTSFKSTGIDCRGDYNFLFCMLGAILKKPHVIFQDCLVADLEEMHDSVFSFLDDGEPIEKIDTDKLTGRVMSKVQANNTADEMIRSEVKVYLSLYAELSGISMQDILSGSIQKAWKIYQAVFALFFDQRQKKIFLTLQKQSESFV